MTSCPDLRVDTLSKQIGKELTTEIIAESESHHREREPRDRTDTVSLLGEHGGKSTGEPQHGFCQVPE